LDIIQRHSMRESVLQEWDRCEDAQFILGDCHWLPNNKLIQCVGGSAFVQGLGAIDVNVIDCARSVSVKENGIFQKQFALAV
jgi:hypothetical protein